MSPHDNTRERLAYRLRTAAQTFATQIDHLSCTPAERVDLRGLPMMMLEIADELHLIHSTDGALPDAGSQMLAIAARLHDEPLPELERKGLATLIVQHVMANLRPASRAQVAQ